MAGRLPPISQPLIGCAYTTLLNGKPLPSHEGSTVQPAILNLTSIDKEELASSNNMRIPYENNQDLWRSAGADWRPGRKRCNHRHSDSNGKIPATFGSCFISLLDLKPTANLRTTDHLTLTPFKQSKAVWRGIGYFLFSQLSSTDGQLRQPHAAASAAAD